MILCARRPTAFPEGDLEGITYAPWAQARLCDQDSEDSMSSEVTPEELIIRRVRERVTGLHPNVFPNVWGDRRIATGVFGRIWAEGFGALEPAEGLAGVRRPAAGTPKCDEWVCHWGGLWLSFDSGDSGVRALVKTWSRLALCGVLGDRPELLDDVIFPSPEEAESEASLPAGSDDKSLPADAVAPAETVESSHPESGSAGMHGECSSAAPSPAEECSSRANADKTPAGSSTPAEVTVKASDEASLVEGREEKTPAEDTASSLPKVGSGREAPLVPSPASEVLAGTKEVRAEGEPEVGGGGGDNERGEEKQSKVVATPAGEGAPVNSPAAVCTDSSGQESTKGSAGEASTKEAPGDMPLLGRGGSRNPPTEEVPGGTSVSGQTDMAKSPVDEATGDVSSPKRIDSKKAPFGAVPGSVSSRSSGCREDVSGR